MKLGWLRRRQIWVFFGVGLLLVLAFSQLPLETWSLEVRDWLKTLGIWAIPAFVLIYVLMSVLCLPNVVLMLIAGTLFGIVSGIVAVSTADTLSAVVCYALGRTIARKRVKRLMNRYPGFAQLDRAVGKNGWKILLLSRLSPVVPSNILNYGFSCTKVNFWQYFFFTWLGMLPVIGLYVYLGYFGSTLIGSSQSPGAYVLQACGLIAALCAAIYTTRLAKTALSRAGQPEPDSEQV
jgi:uncharacterized membrane protein YdjX (TVP38/TMEM64 family)